MTRAKIPEAWPYQKRFEVARKCSNEREVTSSAMRANLPAGRSSFLDIGCGAGELAGPLINQFQRTVLLEPYPPPGAYYIDAHFQENHPQVKFIDKEFSQDTLKELKALQGRFDYILMSQVLYYLKEDWLGLVNGVYGDLLNQNGKIHIFLTSSSSESALLYNRFARLDGHPVWNFDLQIFAQKLKSGLPESARVNHGILEYWRRPKNEEELFQLALFIIGNSHLYDYSHRYEEIYDYVVETYRSEEFGFEIKNCEDFVEITKSYPR